MRGFHYDVDTNTIKVLIEHPNFPITQKGKEIPNMVAHHKRLNILGAKPIYCRKCKTEMLYSFETQTFKCAECNNIVPKEEYESDCNSSHLLPDTYTFCKGI
ncbi:MAG: hypothetical protein ACE5HR_00295 [bacterium]